VAIGDVMGLLLGRFNEEMAIAMRGRLAEVGFWRIGCKVSGGGIVYLLERDFILIFL
jgi:hypothetical protein